jgi:hypothetical protein
MATSQKPQFLWVRSSPVGAAHNSLYVPELTVNVPNRSAALTRASRPMRSSAWSPVRCLCTATSPTRSAAQRLASVATRDSGRWAAKDSWARATESALCRSHLSRAAAAPSCGGRCAEGAGVCEGSRGCVVRVTGCGGADRGRPAGSARQVINTDMSCMSILQFATEYLEIPNVIVCGHYECGGVKVCAVPRPRSAPAVPAPSVAPPRRRAAGG